MFPTDVMLDVCMCVCRCMYNTYTVYMCVSLFYIYTHTYIFINKQFLRKMKDTGKQNVWPFTAVHI